MLVSELVKELQDVLKEDGDLPVYISLPQMEMTLDKDGMAIVPGETGLNRLPTRLVITT